MWSLKIVLAKFRAWRAGWGAKWLRLYENLRLTRSAGGESRAAKSGSIYCPVRTPIFHFYSILNPLTVIAFRAAVFVFIFWRRPKNFTGISTEKLNTTFDRSSSTTSFISPDPKSVFIRFCKTFQGKDLKIQTDRARIMTGLSGCCTIHFWSFRRQFQVSLNTASFFKWFIFRSYWRLF